MTDGGQAPPGIDATVATAARMYDYWLGGHDNFAADRIAALKLAEHSPEAPLVAKQNRKFLGRAVRFAAAGLSGGVQVSASLLRNLEGAGEWHPGR